MKCGKKPRGKGWRLEWVTFPDGTRKKIWTRPFGGRIQEELNRTISSSKEVEQ